MPRDSDSRRREIRSRDYSEDRKRDKYSSRSSKSKKSSSSRRYKSPDERSSSKTSRRRRRTSSSSESSSSSSDSESSGKSGKNHRKQQREKTPIKISVPVIEKKFEIDLFDIPARPEVFEQLDADEFLPKQFAPKKLPESIKIDLESQTIQIPKVESAATEEELLFHKNLFGDDTIRMDKWARKLFLYRQKMISSS